MVSSPVRKSRCHRAEAAPLTLQVFSKTFTITLDVSAAYGWGVRICSITKRRTKNRRKPRVGRIVARSLRQSHQLRMRILAEHDLASAGKPSGRWMPFKYQPLGAARLLSQSPGICLLGHCRRYLQSNIKVLTCPTRSPPPVPTSLSWRSNGLQSLGT
jgi:hypothetical protein